MLGNVILAPGFTFGPCILQAQKPGGVQALGPERTAERFDERLVGGLPRPREVQRHAVQAGQEIKCPAGALRAIIAASHIRKPDGRSPRLRLNEGAPRGWASRTRPFLVTSGSAVPAGAWVPGSAGSRIRVLIAIWGPCPGRGHDPMYRLPAPPSGRYAVAGFGRLGQTVSKFEIITSGGIGI